MFCLTFNLVLEKCITQQQLLKFLMILLNLWITSSIVQPSLLIFLRCLTQWTTLCLSTDLTWTVSKTVGLSVILLTEHSVCRQGAAPPALSLSVKVYPRGQSWSHSYSYINDIDQNVSNVKSQLYTDDTVFYIQPPPSCSLLVATRFMNICMI